MAPERQALGLLGLLPIETRQEIFEHLFSQESTLYLPGQEGSTLNSLRLTSKAIQAEITHWKAHRRTLCSIKERYTKCVFTTSPSTRVTTPSAGDWPHVKDLEIVIDDLKLQHSYQATWDIDAGIVAAQVAGMKADLKNLVAWVCERPTALTSITIRFTHNEYDAPVLSASFPSHTSEPTLIMWELLSPLLKLPVCESTTVEQTDEAWERILGPVDDVMESIYDLDQEYEMEVKFALQGWLRFENARVEHEWEEIWEGLAEYEFEECRGRMRG